MIISTISVFLLIVLTAAVVVVIVEVARLRRDLRRFEQFWQSPTGASLAAESDAPAPEPAAGSVVARQVAELQAAVRKLAARGGRGCDTEESSLPMENAQRMARSGASVDELIRGCGLNRGEAQLVRKLHGRTANATGS